MTYLSTLLVAASLFAPSLAAVPSQPGTPPVVGKMADRKAERPALSYIQVYFSNRPPVIVNTKKHCVLAWGEEGVQVLKGFYEHKGHHAKGQKVEWLWQERVESGTPPGILSKTILCETEPLAQDAPLSTRPQLSHIQVFYADQPPVIVDTTQTCVLVWGNDGVEVLTRYYEQMGNHEKARLTLEGWNRPQKKLRPADEPGEESLPALMGKHPSCYPAAIQ